MRILISKIGCIFRAGGLQPKGEIGETEGLIRHLIDKGHEVTFFGPMIGDIAGLKHVPAMLDDLTSDSDPDYQRECWRDDERRMTDQDMFIQVAGLSSTMSYIDNPHGNIVLSSGVRYVAPILNMTRHLGLPRIIVNNDPRTYPKDQEMAYDKSLIPRALLDQCDMVTTQVVGGIKFNRRSVYASCEAWGYTPICRFIAGDHLAVKYSDRENLVAVLAHAHMTKGARQRQREHAWNVILSGQDWPVYGDGWDGWNINWKGVTKDPFGVLENSKFCPAVGLRDFFTGKVYVSASCGCVPLLYGDGTDPHTWDRKGIYLPLDSEWRITESRSVDDILGDNPEDVYYTMLKYWIDRLNPPIAKDTRWDVLDEMIDAGNASIMRGEWGGYWT